MVSFFFYIFGLIVLVRCNEDKYIQNTLDAAWSKTNCHKGLPQELSTQDTREGQTTIRNGFRRPGPIPYPNRQSSFLVCLSTPIYENVPAALGMWGWFVLENLKGGKVRKFEKC